jgi:hypothetical protein
MKGGMDLMIERIDRKRAMQSEPSSSDAEKLSGIRTLSEMPSGGVARGPKADVRSHFAAGPSFERDDRSDFAARLKSWTVIGPTSRFFPAFVQTDMCS